LSEISNGEKGEQLKKFYVILSFVFAGFILIANSVSATVGGLTEIIVATSEPVALLLFGSVLIGIANVGRKKVLKKENGMEHLGMQPTADSLKENDRLEGWYVGKQVSAGLEIK